MMASVLAGLDRAEREATVAALAKIKNNLRQVIQNRMDAELSERAELEQRYG
jgi:hypothetical protein